MDYYKRVPLTAPELTTFLDRVGQDAIAVSLTSKAGMKPEDYVEVLERRWATQEHDGGAGDEEPTRVRDRSAGRAPAHATPARRAKARTTVSGAGSPPRRPRMITRPARPGLALALGALARLMMILLGLGID
jgi:hypothetical protein